MMKYFLLVLFFLMPLYALSYTKDIKLNDIEKEWIQKHKQIRYSEVNWKPLSIIEDGRMKGIMGDYMDIISQKTGLEFVYVPSRSWPDVLERFKKGEIDVVPGIGSSENETKLGLVSIKYATYPMVIVTTDKYRYIDSLDEFNGKKLAIPKYYTSYNFVKAKYPKIQIIPTKEIPEALLDVASSKAEAFVGHIATSLYYISELQLTQLKISGTTDFIFEHHYLVQRDQEILLHIINKAIRSISQEQRSQIQAKWIKTKVEKEVSYTLLYKTLAVVGIILFFLFYRQKELQAINKKIRKLQERLELALLGSQEAFFDLDLDTKELYLANQWRLMLGLKEKKDERYTLDEWLEYIDPEEREDIVKKLYAHKNEIGYYLELTHKAKAVNGQWKWILLRAKIYQRENGSYHLVGTLSDITQKILMEEQMRFHTLVLEQVHESIIMTDLEGKVIFWNKGATKIFGYTAQEMLGKPVNILTPKEDLEKTKKGIQEVLKNGHYTDEVYRITKDGRKIYISLRLSLIKDEKGNPLNIVGFSQDLTEKKLFEDKLKKQQEILYYQAMFDALTELPNRALFKDRLKQAIENSKREGTKLGIMFIDLDNFKIINDSFGHEIGDEVLIQVAHRLQSVLREQDTVARIGGDEFIVIVENLATSTQVAKVAQKLLEQFKEPFIIEHKTFYLTCSIGISIYPDDSVDDEDLVKYADTAMYKAKENGKNNFEFYSSEMTALAFERVVMEANIRKAIINEEFEVYFQPQIDIKQNRLRGMEVLVRWNHPQMGMITPANFIPIAEASGLIVELDRYLLRQTLNILEGWIEEGIEFGKVYLNLSMKQLQKDDFIAYLKEHIENSKCNYNQLGLEVTESEIMKDPQKSIHYLNEIQKLGIELSVDDFGTGYSSLAYLKRLPIDELKIDRSFIVNIPDDEEDIAIIKMILALAKTLGLHVVAEGVETKEQLEFFKQSGCDYVQGYFFARPMNATEMKKYIQNNSLKTLK